MIKTFVGESVTRLPSLTRSGILTSAFIFAAFTLSEVVVNHIEPHREEMVDANVYPWASIGKVSVIDSKRSQLCIGSMIGPNQVLTAAHCFYNRLTAHFVSAESIHVLFGYARGEYRVHTVASRYVIAPTYNPTNLARIRAGDDWAVVYTKQPFPKDIRPLRLATVAPPLETAVKIGGYPIKERLHIMTADLHCRIKAVSLDGKLLDHDCLTHHGDSGGPLLSAGGGSEGLIWGVQILGYSLLVERKERSIEGGSAVSASSIAEFLASQVVSSVEDQKISKVSDATPRQQKSE